jgi:hypothetical protein
MSNAYPLARTVIRSRHSPCISEHNTCLPLAGESGQCTKKGGVLSCREYVPFPWSSSASVPNLKIFTYVSAKHIQERTMSGYGGNQHDFSANASSGGYNSYNPGTTAPNTAPTTTGNQGYPPHGQQGYPPPAHGQGYPPADHQGHAPPPYAPYAGGQQHGVAPPHQGEAASYYGPPAGHGQPPPNQGYPPPMHGYPPQQRGYPPQDPGWYPPQGHFPPAQGHQPAYGGHGPPPMGGYAPVIGGYPQTYGHEEHAKGTDHKDHKASIPNSLSL